MIMISHSRPVGRLLLTWGFPVGAGDGNRTRIISLGSGALRGSHVP